MLMTKHMTAGRTLLVFTGLVLLLINCVGFFVPLRHPDIYTEQYNNFEGDITLTEAQFYNAIAPHRLSGVSDADYVTTVNQTVQQGIAHYWHPEERGLYKYGHQVPLHENYLLFLAGYINPDVYGAYEFCDYRKAIERGVGLCSQHAMVVVQLLRSQDIPAYIVGLAEAHVVATAQVEPESNTWWVIDPDYGVVIPYSIHAISEKPALVQPYYQQAGYSVATMDTLVAWYSTEDIRFNRVCHPQKQRVEQLSYVAAWIIPLLCISIGALPYVRHLRLSHRRTLI